MFKRKIIKNVSTKSMKFIAHSYGSYDKKCLINFKIRKMIHRIIRGTGYSIVVFCVVSYISVMVSLLASVGEPTKKPVANIGFPFKYYYQFWLRGSDSPNCGWVFDNFVWDCVLTWIVTVVVYFIVKSNKRKL